MSQDPLLQPFQLKHLTLKNRILSTAHEPGYTHDGLPKERYRLYHAEKAKGGIGMTMIGGSSVVDIDSPQAFMNIQLHKDECVKWLRELADDVHSHGAAVMIQMTHMGSRTNWSKADWLPILGPTGMPEPAHRAFPKEMEDWDFDRVVAAYADASERVKEAGLDGIELECASHLMAQFWSPGTNKRADEYGGSLDNRMRFIRDVIKGVRDRVGAEFIVGVRMVCDEQWDKGLARDEGVEIARRLATGGQIDFINVIRGRVATDEGLSRVIPNMGSPSAPHLDFAGDVRESTRLPTFHAARIQDVATARHAIAEGKVDIVGMTRAHMADPHIVRKIAEGRESQIRPCVGMGFCIDSVYWDSALCVHNVSTGREASAPHVVTRSDNPGRRVVIVGAGPAGLEAARVAAEGGHDVTVYEAGPNAGGQILLTAALKRRREVVGIVDWRLQECERLGVDIRYNHFATSEDVMADGPDLVVIATGGLPSHNLLGAGEDLATSSWDVLSGSVALTGSVIFCDNNASHSAMTTAEFMAEKGVDFELVTPERTLAPDVGSTNYPHYFRSLNKAGVAVSLNLRIERLERKGNRIAAVFKDEYAGREVVKEADHVVIEYGTKPLDELYFELKPHSINRGEVDYRALTRLQPQTLVRNPDGQFRLFRVGDAVASRNIHAAIFDGYRFMASC